MAGGTLVLLAGLALAFWLVGPLRDVAAAALDGDGGLVRSRMQALGAAGALVLVALILAHAVIPYPAEVATAAAGYLYGFALATPLMLTSWLLTALIAYALARAMGRPAVRRLIGPRRLAAAERLAARGGATGLLAARLIPIIPFNAVCYAAGIAQVPLGRYVWTTVVGIAPLTLTVTYLGSRLQTTDLTDPRLWLPSGALLIILLAARYLRRERSARS